MDATSLEIMAALAGAAGVIATQIRKGIRDRGDRNALINNPYVADHLVELRRRPDLPFARPKPGEPRSNLHRRPRNCRQGRR